jgi:predicted transcriptional regulator
MDPLPAIRADVPVVGADSYLREALGMLMESGAPYLIVQDDTGEHIGSLSMSAIQRAASPPDR